jgi:hypothetical protein
MRCGNVASLAPILLHVLEEVKALNPFSKLFFPRIATFILTKVLHLSLVPVLLTPQTAGVHEGPPSDPDFGTRGMPPQNYLTDFPSTW